MMPYDKCNNINIQQNTKEKNTANFFKNTIEKYSKGEWWIEVKWRL